jgi:hypothetical protein
MIQDEIHRAGGIQRPGRFVEIGRRRSQSTRRTGSSPSFYLPYTAELKFEFTSGYHQDAKRR